VSPGEAGQPEPRFLTERYDASYYAHYYSAGERVPYERNQQWLGFFAGVADRIRSDIAPATTLDVGCAHGFLVESLTDRGVDAHGFDVSEFAISQVRDDVKPKCWVGSVLEPIPGHYDLVTCFEVLEHLEVEDADRAVANLCTIADDILFSSTPTDFRQETHVNVRPPEFWAELFARHGFVHDVGFDASFVAWWAVRYRRARDPWYRLAADYERELWRLRQEAEERTAIVLSQQDRIETLDGPIPDEANLLSRLEAEMAGLSRQLADSHAALVGAAKDAQKYRELRGRAGVRFGIRLDATARRLLPIGTRRRNATRLVLRGTAHPVRAMRGATRRVIGRAPRPGGSDMEADYQTWLAANEPSADRLMQMRAASREWTVRPLLSVVLPVHDPDAAWLREAIRSVRDQAYEGWELCVADDASKGPHVREILDAEAAADSRIRITYRTKNGGIAKASNSALAMANGDFVAFLDHDDILRPHALWEVVARIRRSPDVDIIYSDEDLILPDGRRGGVFFKPNWSPAWLLSQNYITHLMVVRRTCLEDVDGFREGYDGSQDHDLLLRLTENTTRVEHIADVLYSWRQVPGSTALHPDNKPLARLAGRQCVQDALDRRGTPGHVDLGPTPGVYDVRYDVVGTPAVGIIIPTRDRLDLLRPCIASVDKLSSYSQREIIILDNDSRETATRAYLATCGHRVVAAPGPFNYSRIINAGVRSTSTPYVVLLNNDTVVLSEDWIECLLELCQQPDIGVVGCTLVHADGRLQHTGIGVGYGHLAYNLGVGWPVLRDASAVTGACMMVKREVFDLVGGFDESLAVAYNDVDFCLRVRQHGLRVVYTPFARLKHEESSSRGALDPSADHDVFRARWDGEDTLEDPFLNPNVRWPDAGRLRLPGD
jgi:GT2 family glycosyltransferase